MTKQPALMKTHPTCSPTRLEEACQHGGTFDQERAEQASMGLSRRVSVEGSSVAVFVVFVVVDDRAGLAVAGLAVVGSGAGDVVDLVGIVVEQPVENLRDRYIADERHQASPTSPVVSRSR